MGIKVEVCGLGTCRLGDLVGWKVGEFDELNH